MSEKKKNKFNALSILNSPFLLLTNIIIGVLIGLYFKNIVKYIAPFGNFYIALLQMSVLPIMISAIVLSLGKIIKDKNAYRVISKIFLFFIITMLITGFFALTIGLIFKPGDISPEIKKNISNIILSNENNMTRTDSTGKKNFNMLNFFLNIVPNNIFKALNDGSTLQILFFFILFAIMLKFVPDNLSSNLMGFFESVYSAFEKMVGFTLYILPFGIIALIAEQISNIGIELIYSLLKFIIIILSGVFVQFIISTIIISLRSKSSILEVLKNLKDVIFISLFTRSSITSIPASLNGLIKGLKFDRDLINLSLPLGIAVARYANMFTFPLTVIFMSQIYYIPLTITQLILSLLITVLAAVATAGAPGVVALSMVSIVLVPLGIPASTAVIILIALDPILDPFLTLLNSYSNCMLSSLAVKNQKDVG